MRTNIIIALAVMAMSALGCGKGSASDGPKGPTELPVEASVAVQKEWVEEVSTYGVVKLPDKVEIFSKAAGKVMKLMVKEEQKVGLDEVVASVDRDQVGEEYKEVLVKSTVVGKVENIFLKEGAKVLTSEPIMTVTRDEDLKLVVALAETDLAKVKLGQAVSIMMDALPEQKFNGKVGLIRSQIDPKSGKGEVEVVFDKNYQEVIPGMFGRAKIVVGRRQAVVIPSKALRRVDDKDAVYVVDNGKAKIVFVELGQESAGSVEVVKGLASGATVITFAKEGLTNGSLVKVLKGE